MQTVYKFFGGRSTLFAFVVLAIGTGLAITHSLDMTFVALIAAIQTLVVARAISEDRTPPKD